MAQSGILSMFGRSPIRPLQQHMEKAHACANLLLPYFDAVLADDWQTAKSLQQDIADYEHEADALKMDFRLHLPKGLFLPVPRMDLLELLDKQELIANTAKDIAGIVLGRKMQIPHGISTDFKAFLTRALDASSQAMNVINELDELLESGFRGKEVALVETMVEALNKIEDDTDQMQINLRQSIFSLEKTLSPVDVMFLYKIIEGIGLLADSAEQVGHRLRMLTAN
jgi:uncharacterized protein